MYFDDVAIKWDDKRRCERAQILSAELKKEWNGREVVVLDFGCGTGLLTYALYPYAAAIYGYDTSIEMQKVFQLKREMYHADNVTLATAEKVKESTFDVIFSSMVFHHIIDVKAKIAELKKSLAPDGLFMWIDLDEEDGSFHKNEPDFHGYNGFSRKEVQNILQDCSFHEISIKTIYQGEKIIENEPIAYSLFLATAR